MPTREYKRLWCKTCNDWELFEQHYPNWKEWFCKKCEKVHEKIDLAEIPTHKVLEQRKRYVEWNAKESNKFFGELMMSPEQHRMKEFIHMFSEPKMEVEIKEDDAGQIAIDQEKRRIRDEARRKRVQRNDTCPCGSGKKYKKCCLTGVNELLIEYNLRF